MGFAAKNKRRPPFGERLIAMQLADSTRSIRKRSVRRVEDRYTAK
jgi:hypothetical protein